MPELRQPPPVGVIGLGRMGSVIAERLSQTYSVFGWDVREQEGSSPRTLSHPEAIASECDIILLCLPSPVETVQILSTSFLANLSSRHVVVDMSTSDPASARRFSESLAATGAHFLDAPILGRPDTCGSWTLPVGGDADALERARPVLSGIATRIFHAGASGTGHMIKLLNNLMFAAINTVTAEVIGACEHLGVPPERFLEVVGGSAAATVSPLFLDLVPRMIDPTPPVFTVDLLRKDLKLVVEMCQADGATLHIAPALQTVTDLANAAGLGNKDSAALVELYRDNAAKAASEH
jgi:3-hydroxyisobutyrate dehydrogenase